ncbi:MAG: hypothetical protein U0269_09920 [Polyangiales bacterium]
MTALERAAQAVVARWIEDESLARSIEREITEELVAAHRASLCAVIDDDSGAAIAVIEGTRAWLLGAAGASSERVRIERLAEECRALGATRLWSGGPPRWYLRSGVSVGSQDELAFRSLGGQEKSRHLDLWVTTRGVQPPEPTVATAVERVCDDDAFGELARWVRADFSEAWADEARAAFGRGGLFVARSDREIAAFAAHSGHCAAAGTFGPLGARASARGRGWGAAVAKSALRDLAERGFERACVPWVDEAVAAFYERIAPEFSLRPRVLYSVDLTAR